MNDGSVFIAIGIIIDSVVDYSIDTYRKCKVRIILLLHPQIKRLHKLAGIGENDDTNKSI